MHAYVQLAFRLVETRGTEIIDALPAGFLDSRYVPLQSIHSEVILGPESVGWCLYASRATHSCHAEMTKDTTTFASFSTSVIDLGIPGVCVHLRELQLCLSSGSWW